MTQTSLEHGNTGQVHSGNVTGLSLGLTSFNQVCASACESSLVVTNHPCTWQVSIHHLPPVRLRQPTLLAAQQRMRPGEKRFVSTNRHEVLQHPLFDDVRMRTLLWQGAARHDRRVTAPRICYTEKNEQTLHCQGTDQSSRWQCRPTQVQDYSGAAAGDTVSTHRKRACDGAV